ILNCVSVSDLCNFLSGNRPARVCEQLLVQPVLDYAGIVRRRQLWTREIGLQELIRDHEPATRVAIEQVVSARDPEIVHRCRRSSFIFPRLRVLSASESSSTPMKENALP